MGHFRDDLPSQLPQRCKNSVKPNKTVGTAKLQHKQQLQKLYAHIQNYIYTVSQKKFPPLNSLQLCQILTDFQNFCTARKRMKFATKPCDITHLTLGMLLHYLEKLKFKFSTDNRR